MKLYIDLEDDTTIPEEFFSFSKKENTLLFLTGFNSVKVFKTNAIQDNTYFDTLKRELAHQYEVAIKTKDDEIATLTVSNDTKKTIYDQLVEEEKARREKEIARERATAQETIDALKQELFAARITIENYKTNMENEVSLQILREKAAIFEKNAALQEKYNELLLEREREKKP